jgi:hypothetical protein
VFQVFESFETEQTVETGDVPLPDKNDKLLGGHAITLYGYDDEKATHKYIYSIYVGPVARSITPPETPHTIMTFNITTVND